MNSLHTKWLKFVLGFLSLTYFFAVGPAAAAPDGAAIVVPLEEIERARKRLYPGGRDEEDLKVQASLPEAVRKTDERSIQKEVYKSVFNQEMKDQAEQPVDEPIGESEDGQ